MVTSFPFGNGLIEQAFTVFRGSSETLISFVPLIFLVRLVIIQATVGGKTDYSSLLKELLFLYVGFFVFQEVMEIVMRAPEVADHMLKHPDPIMMPKKTRGWIEIVTDFFALDLVNMISSAIYWIVCFCYLILMSFLITIGAYIILFSTMFRMKWMFKAYFSLVLILSIWPFVWYSVDQAFVFVVKSMETTEHNSGVIIAKFMGGILKLSVPIVAAFVAMKAPVAAALAGVGQVAGAAKGAAKVASFGAKGLKGAGKAFGVHHAAEVVRGNPNKQAGGPEESRKARRFSTADTAPMIAYGIHRARFGLKNNNKIEMGTSSNGGKVGNYPDLATKHSSYRSYKNNLKERYDTRKEIQQSASHHTQSRSSHSHTERTQHDSRSSQQNSHNTSRQDDVKVHSRPSNKRSVHTREFDSENQPTGQTRSQAKKTSVEVNHRYKDPSLRNNPQQPFRPAEPTHRIHKGDFK